MEAWSNFFFAEAGAAAALVGLVFVAMSINLSKILASRRLTSRGFEALTLLTMVLIAALLMLIPNQDNTKIGIELLIVGGVAWGWTTWVNIRDVRTVEAQYRRYAQFRFLSNQIATLPYLISALRVMQSGSEGLYWLVMATILSIVNALLDTWVLLVEINR